MTALRSGLRNRILATIARHARLTDPLLGAERLWEDLGIDSITMTELLGKLERELELRIPSELEPRLAEIGTVDDLIALFAEHVYEAQPR